MNKCSKKLELILQEFDMPAFPDLARKMKISYTDYLVSAHNKKINTDPNTKEEYVYTPKRNRQCAIGWHSECSIGDCGCVCHQIMKTFRIKKSNN